LASIAYLVVTRLLGNSFSIAMRILKSSFVARLGLVLLLSGAGLLRAQTPAALDLATVSADPVKLIFSDERTTVASYVYGVLERQTACCGSDAIYLEVKIGADGKTSAVRALTGRNDCLKRSVADILRDIKWDVSKFPQGRTSYFELKPVLICRGVQNENVYKPIGSAAAIAEQQTAQTAAQIAQTASQTAAQPAPKPTEPSVAPAAPEAKPSPIAAATPAKPEPKPEPKKPAPKPEPTKPATVEPIPAPEPKVTATKAPEPKVAESKVASPMPAPAPVAEGISGSTALPAQRYSASDRKPDASHATTHLNAAGPLLGAPEYIDGEALQALFLKQQLRKAGVCGLVHVFAEVTVDKANPADTANPNASVVSYRIFRANNKQVLETIPGILSQLRYKAASVRFKQNLYIEFKADVDCGTAPINLGGIPDYLNNPEKAQ
jgi:hypothetical protein